MSLQQQTEKYRRLVRSERFRDRLKRMSFPGFEGIPVYDVFLKFREEIKEDGLSIRASSISYFFILALFPSIIFFFSLIPYVPIDHFDSKILNGLKGILPIGIFSILETTIHDIVSVQRGGLVSINFFLALFVASNGVNSIMRAFDKMNQTFKKRNFFQKKIAAFQILFLISMQLIIAFLLIIKGKEFIQLILNWLNTEDAIISFVVRFTKTLLILFSFFNIFALIYYFGPSVKKRYRYFSVGATFATLFSILMSIVFKFYTSYLNNFNRLYGSLGIMIVIMLLIYLNALVLLFGFELNNSIAVNKALRESDSNSDSDSEIKHL
ncbi:MAG: YihY/virulence factor BrkB family protein [Chitinophagales bacterium]|nr:YihY/virulence factor BrkB family protein [Saprospirales bacterium]MBP6660091.1 YihY/virulence factor BrkB family protein [Chitinophagales bacterium]HUM52436.1 YihY/virulence factor BrkB family protein [Chitinophagales bacterium]